MSKEDAVKTGLVMVHAMLDKVQDNWEEVAAYEASTHRYDIEPSEKEAILMSMTGLAEQSLDMVTKASVLAGALCATLEDRTGKNAVLQNALKALSHAYGTLLRIQSSLGATVAEPETVPEE